MTQKLVAIKILNPIKKAKVRREVKVMETLTKAGVQVPKLIEVVRDPTNKTNEPSLVMEYIPSEGNIIDLYHKMTPADLKNYMFQLLKIVNDIHALGIMHADIKPDNIVIDTTQKKLYLIDFGFSQFYIPEQNNDCRA